MTENNEVVEQKERVSENLDQKQDTEHVVSSEEIVDKKVDNEPQPPEEEKKESSEEIKPHERTTESANIEDIKSLKQETKNIDTVGDIDIDMSKIVLDKEGIPEFTKADAKRIISSGLALTNIESEIEDSREIIREMRNILDIDKQNALEESYRKSIDEANKKLETEKDEAKIKELNDDIKVFGELVTNLPKYNKEIKLECEKRELNAKKHIASYQNISRVNIRKLENDGTIASLISSTSNGAFAQAFLDAERKFKDLPSLEEDPDVVKNKIDEKIENINYIGVDLENAFKTLKNIDFDFLVNHNKELNNPNNKFSDEISKEISQKDLANVPNLLFDSTFSNSQSSFDTLSDLKTSLVSLGDIELQELRDKKILENKYVDDYSDAFQAIVLINNYYPHFVRLVADIKELEPSVKITDEDRKYEQLATKFDANCDLKTFKEKLEKIQTRFNEIWEKFSEIYYRESSKYEEAKSKIINPAKDYIKKYGFFNAFIVYSNYVSKFRGSYAKPESAMEFQHLILFSEAFCSLIKNNMDSDDEKSYEQSKNSINSVSMNLSNIIRYFCDLYENNVNIEWAAGFDPDSNLKNFYNDYKNEIDAFVKEYIDTRNVFSHVLCHNSKMFEKYTTFISDVVDYINEKQNTLKKIDSNQKVKDKYKVMTNVSFAYQYVQSYNNFESLFKEINKAIVEKRNNEPNISDEDFKKWYNENYLDKEHEATRRVIDSFLHLTLGCNIIYAFSDFNDYFKEHNSNKALRSDVNRYLLNEYILESMAFRYCDKNSTYEKYIREKSKSVAFKSIDYSFQRDVDTNIARAETVSCIFSSAINAFRSLINNICGAEKEEVKEKKNKKKNNKKKENKNFQKIYKEKAREKKKLIGNYTNALSEYNKLIKESKDTSAIELESTENKFCVHVCPFRDTKVIIRVERYNKSIPSNVKNFIEKSIIDPNKNISIKEAYNFSKSIPNESLTDLGKRYYYNQYIDRSFAKDDLGVSFDYKLLSTIVSQDQRLRYIVDFTLNNASAKIIEKIIENIKKSGIDFTNKSISIKDNCKFDIKYFKNKNFILESSKNNGNLDFYKTRFWEIVSFELNYDIINTSKK